MLKILYNVGFVASFWNIPSETLYVLGARKELSGFQNSWISCFSFNTRKVSAAKYVYRLFTVSKCNSTLLSESTCLSQVCHQLSRYWCATDHKKTKTAQKLTRNSQETTRKRHFPYCSGVTIFDFEQVNTSCAEVQPLTFSWILVFFLPAVSLDIFHRKPISIETLIDSVLYIAVTLVIINPLTPGGSKKVTHT